MMNQQETDNRSLREEIHRIASEPMSARKEDRKENFQNILSLADQAGDDHVYLVRQIALAMAEDGSEERAPNYGVIFRFLNAYLGIGEMATARAVLPYLDSNNEKLQDAAELFLKFVEKPTSGLSIYQSLLESGTVSETLLVRHMIQYRPHDTVWRLGRTMIGEEEERKAVALAVRHVDDTLWKQFHMILEDDEVEPAAAEAMERLAASGHWWVRLYVAEIIRKHPEFAQPEIVQRLRKDPRRVVREALADEERK